MKGAAEQIRVSLVIPGRNVSETIAACLRAVSQLLGRDGLEEIVFVDDGSTDQTSELVQGYPVHWVRSEGRGAAAARNVGWQAARMPFIWFIDADCVAEPQALRLLLAHLKDPQVAAVGGSYANLRPEHLLACLVHEEIIQRHLRMPKDVNVLASYHVIYRREVLEKVDRPLAAPSANPFGLVSPTRAEHVASSFGHNSPYILDGGSTEHGIESTILSLLDPVPAILRLGPLSPDDLGSVLGGLPAVRLQSEDSRPKAPGNLTRHYSPNASLQLHPNSASIHRAIENISNPQTVGILLLERPSPNENWPDKSKLLWLSEGGDLNEAAFMLYDALRELDTDPLVEKIHCHAVPDKGIGPAINDRLSRAAH